MDLRRNPSERTTLLKFILRKTWILCLDHVGTMILLNLGFSILSALVFIAARAGLDSFPLFAGILFIGVWILTWYLRGMAVFLRKIVTYGEPYFRDFFHALKTTLGSNLAPGALYALYIILPTVAVPFYFTSGNFGGYMAAGVIFWIYLATLPAVFMVLPLSIRGERISWAIKRAFQMLFAEPRIMMVLALNSAALLALSLLTGFILPGAASVLILLLSAAEVLTLEPGSDRNVGDSMNTIQEEKERLGKRSLKGFIFPWKDGE